MDPTERALREAVEAEYAAELQLLEPPEYPPTALYRPREDWPLDVDTARLNRAEGREEARWRDSERAERERMGGRR